MHCKSFITIIVVLLLGGALSAQPKFNNPLTHLGLGEVILNKGHHLELMGGQYGGYADPALVNVVNPASLGFLQWTAFDIAADFGRSGLDDGHTRQSNYLGNLRHFTLAFPLRNSISEVLERKSTKTSWGMGFDLRYNSRVGYDLEVIDSLQEEGRVQRNYYGSGGTYNFGWINAYRYKSLSVGLDVGVFFGNIDVNREIYFLDLLNPADDVFVDEISLRGFRWKLGLQYKYLLNKKVENDHHKRYLTLGLYGNSNQSVHYSNDALYRSIRRSSSTIQDTLTDISSRNGNGVYPGVVGMGVTYQPDLRWMIGLNLENTWWTSFDVPGLKVGAFSNGYKLGLGASFVPDQNAFGEYLKRVEYRAGVQYIVDGRRLNDHDLITNKITFGMSMPFYYLRQISRLHVGLEYARTDAGSILENYYGLTIGATFNDNQWFFKRKFK